MFYTSPDNDLDEAGLRLRALFERERRRGPLKSALVTGMEPMLRTNFALENFILEIVANVVGKLSKMLCVLWPNVALALCVLVYELNRMA